MERRARTETLRRFGAEVRRHRLEVGLSQERLASLSGLDRTYVGGVERGERNVGVVNVVRIADALGIAPADLLKHLGARDSA